MLNYYDELKNDILEVLEEDEDAKNILQSENAIAEKLIDYLIDRDEVTGNASGSYYMNTYESRKHCYNYFRDVFEALEESGYNSELEKFKLFVSLVEEGYIDVDTMQLDDDMLYEEEKEYIWYIVDNFEECKELNFETLDVITRCYLLTEVVYNVVKALKK